MEKQATYFYNRDHSWGIYHVLAVYETRRDHSNRNVNYYNIYDDAGNCVNEGEPYYQFPTFSQIFERYYMMNVH
jgi:hypothetical protein